MPANELVVENGFSLSAIPQGAGIPNTASFQYVKIIDPKLKCSQQKVLLQTLVTIASGCSSSGGKCTGSGSISATAAKTKSNKMPVLRKGDTGTCNGMAQVGNSVTPASCRLEIVYAGQVKTKGE